MSKDQTFLDKLEGIAPPQLTTFDAFPKLPATYKTRSESRGWLTLFVSLLALLLVLNDIGEYIWGWPDHEFSIDSERSSLMDINVDMVVNMPCQYLSIDLRDAIGDRLFLSAAFTRDGTKFDIGQATVLKEHAKMLSARQAVSQSRKSRGFFSTLFRSNIPAFKPTYNHQADGSACRVYGSVKVKKVTANLHITTLGHGYSSNQHVDHNLMNLSHVITEFSIGPYFPDIAQPLDDSFELADDPFLAYQYFLHVVPTTYIAPRTAPLQTNQYSVTHYTRKVEHGRATPGIFFKFDLEPLSLTIHQRTTTLTQLLIRCIGVIGGVFICMSYAVRIGTKAVEVVTGGEEAIAVTPVQASGAKRKWGGGELRSRRNGSVTRVVQQGTGWTVEKDSPYGSPYASPVPSPFLNPNGSTTPAFGPMPIQARTPSFGHIVPSPQPRSSSLGVPPSPYVSRSPYMQSSSSRSTSDYISDSVPNTPAAGYSHFPPTPGPTSGFGLGLGLPNEYVNSDGTRGQRSASQEGTKRDD